MQPNMKNKFRSGDFSQTKEPLRKPNWVFSKSWIKPYDVVIWIFLAVIIVIGSISVRTEKEIYDPIKIEERVTKLKDVIAITDKKAAEFNKKAKLAYVSGNADGEENIVNRNLRLNINYDDVDKGIDGDVSHTVRLSIDMKKQEISYINYERDPYYYDLGEEEIYDPKNFDIDDVYEILYKTVDMKTALSLYRPMLYFDIMGDRCHINLTYFKNKNDVSDENPDDVSYNIEVDVKTKEVLRTTKQE